MAADEMPPLWAQRLRAERERRSWNKHEMARRLQKAIGRPYPPVTSLVRQILGWEKGEHFPRDWTTAYATAFDMPEDELFPPVGRSSAVSEDDVRRRALFGLLGVTTAAGLAGRAGMPRIDAEHALTGRPSEQDADVIRDMLRALITSDRQFGGAHARIYATEYLAAVIQPRLHAAVRGGRDRRLLAVSVEFTMRVSAMHLDAGDENVSLALLGDALGMAQQSDDLVLTAWVLSRRGEYEIDQAAVARTRRAERAYVAHVERALSYSGSAAGLARKAPPGARAFLHAKKALAWSMAGDRDQTERSLGAMWDSYACVGEKPEPGWMGAYGLGNLQHEATRAYCNLGMGEQAARAAEKALPLRAAQRPKAFSLGVLAIGQARAGDLSQACATARRLLDLATSLGSRRVWTRVTEVLHALRPYRHDPEVAELFMAYRPALRGIDP